MLTLVFNALSALIIIRAIASWIDPAARHPIVRTLDSITEPMLKPIRKLIPPTGGIDFSPMVLLVLIMFLRGMLRV